MTVTPACCFATDLSIRTCPADCFECHLLVATYVPGSPNLSATFIATFSIEWLNESGLSSARPRSSRGRRPAITNAGIRCARVWNAHGETSVPLCATGLGVSKTALFRYVSPTGELRSIGQKILGIQEEGA